MPGNGVLILLIMSGEIRESQSEVLQPGLGRELDLMIIIVLLF